MVRAVAPESQRVPPHDTASEQALLGCLFFYPDAVAESVAVLSPNDFYSPAHARVFKAICQMQRDGDPVDQVTTSARLDGDDKMLVLDLATQAGTSRHVKSYIASIKGKSTLRSMIRECSRLTIESYEALDAESITGDALKTMMRLQDSGLRDSASIHGIVDSRIDHMSEARLYFTTPCDSPHIKPGNLVVLGGRPGTGKSALALWWADEWSRSMRVAFFSYEMDEEELADRLICNRTKLPIEELDEGLSEAAINSLRTKMDELRTRNLSVKVAAGLRESQLEAALRRFRAGGGNVAVVDYIQIACDDTGNPTNDTARFSKMLKRTALDTGLVIVALSQFKRPKEDEKPRYPSLSDFKQSGALEQDANLACLMFRYPDRDTQEGQEARDELLRKGISIDRENNDTLLRLHWAKARQGRQKVEHVYFEGAAMSFKPVVKPIPYEEWEARQCRIAQNEQ